VVPLLLVCLGRRPTPTTGRSRAGDRHLNFYETRDNLPIGAAKNENRQKSRE